MDNNVTVVGNLARDPELKYTTGGRGVASFGLAVNRKWQQNGEWQEQVSFFNVTCWGTLGENVAASLTKGHRVIVSGRLEQRSWENKDGDKRSVVEIVADSVGPDLRWAQCQVERNEREDTAGRGTSGGSKRSQPVYGDEEPFARHATEMDL